MREGKFEEMMGDGGTGCIEGFGGLKRHAKAEGHGGLRGIIRD